LRGEGLARGFDLQERIAAPVRGHVTPDLEGRAVVAGRLDLVRAVSQRVVVLDQRQAALRDHASVETAVGEIEVAVVAVLGAVDLTVATVGRERHAVGRTAAVAAIVDAVVASLDTLVDEAVAA